MNNEWASIGAPPPTPYHVLRPEWFELSVLSAGIDSIGYYVDIGVDTIAYVPPGDLNNDGQFNSLDVDRFVSGWMTDTRGLNSIAQQMQGDLDRSGRVDLTDAHLLRSILLQHGGSSYSLMSRVPEPSGTLILCVGLAIGWLHRQPRLRPTNNGL